MHEVLEVEMEIYNYSKRFQFPAPVGVRIVIFSFKLSLAALLVTTSVSQSYLISVHMTFDIPPLKRWKRTCDVNCVQESWFSTDLPIL